jgi:hypothetical protein
MALPFGSGFSPNKQSPAFSSGVLFPTITPYEATLTTGGGAVTLTAAQLLGGLLVVNCDDAQTLNLPTATLLNAAIPAVAEGVSFAFEVVNIGDTTLTIGVGTGGDATVGNSKDSVLTIVANASKRFILRVTGVATESVSGSTDSYVLYGMGSVAAATA